MIINLTAMQHAELSRLTREWKLARLTAATTEEVSAWHRQSGLAEEIASLIADEFEQSGPDPEPPTILVQGDIARHVSADQDTYLVRLVRPCPEGHDLDCPHTESVGVCEGVVASAQMQGSYDTAEQIPDEALRALVAEMLAGR
jgi:hypothetical protein